MTVMRNQIYVVPFCLMFLWNSLPAQHSDAVVKLSEWEASKGAHETNTLVQITGKAILKQRGQEKSQSQGTFRIVTIRGNAHAKIELGAAGGLQVGVNEKIT